MEIDVAKTIGAVVREVSSRDVDGQLARVIVATRTYATDVGDLWDALTNAERIPRWFLPVTGDLKLGGKFQFQGNAGGDINECVAPKHLAITWGMHGQVSWVTLDLSPKTKRSTELRLEHVAHVPEPMWNDFGPGAVGSGWDQAMLGLDRHFATGGAAVDPKEFFAWIGSDDGKAFVRQSSDDWCRAQIADGADPAVARAGAEKVFKFYTGT
jgi:uncharacterized protein YndB with AHSA1/START domain